MATQQPLPDLTESQRPSLYAAAIVTYFLATSAVVLRFVARRLTHLNYWYDDWLIVGAWLAVTAFFIDEFIWIHLGLGVHYQTLTMSYTTITRNIMLNLFVEDMFYSTGTVFSKLSLLAFYWRIFKVANIRWPIRIIATAAICWLIARYIAITLHCVPVAAYWDKTIQNATCRVNDRLLFMGTNTVNFFIDLTILILPMPYIQKLQIRKSQKIAVFGMFTLGGFIVAVSIILLIVCYRLDNTSADITWTLSPVALWAGTEINLAVVTACLPSLRPIFSLVTGGTARPGGGSSSSGGGGAYHNDSSHGFRSKGGVSLFGSRSRTVRAFSGTDAVEDHDHPFEVIGDRKNMLEGGVGVKSEQRGSDESRIDLEEVVRPPRDRVMVREDFSVKYSNV